jgi:hypothetical protein
MPSLIIFDKKPLEINKLVPTNIVLFLGNIDSWLVDNSAVLVYNSPMMMRKAV